MKAEFVAAFKNVTVRNLLIILLAVLLIMGGCEGKARLEQYRFYRFEPVAWAQAKRSGRYLMAKYLLDKQMLLGKSKLEVIEMLGTPTWDNNLYMNYALGHEQGRLINLHTYELRIQFDDSAPPVVTHTRINVE